MEPEYFNDSKLLKQAVIIKKYHLEDKIYGGLNVKTIDRETLDTSFQDVLCQIKLFTNKTNDPIEVKPNGILLKDILVDLQIKNQDIDLDNLLYLFIFEARKNIGTVLVNKFENLGSIIQAEFDESFNSLP